MFSSWFLFVENGFRFGRVTTKLILEMPAQQVENGFRFGRVTTLFICSFCHVFLLLLKMASDSEGLRPWGAWGGAPPTALKMASDSEGLRQLASLTSFMIIPLKMASDSEGLRPPPFLKNYDVEFRWKWLPIRKGYDLIHPDHRDFPVARWKWLPIRKGYDKYYLD